MRMAELHGEYDAVFSLGWNCLVSIQLENNGLRTFSGVIDWMRSDKLSNVNRLLEKRFADFMLLRNLKIRGPDGSGKNYMVEDELYRIISVHDLPMRLNPGGNLLSYNDFQAKLQRRIHRFFYKAATGSRLLFTRLEGTYEEALRLKEILSGMVAGDFSILLIRESACTSLIDCDWPDPGICCVQMPSHDIWNYETNPHWKQLFQGITVKSD